MSQVFPYGITLQEGGTIAVFPAAEVSFSAADGERFSLFLIIDSGATISALPKSDAQIMGIAAEQGASMVVAGITGQPLVGWRHDVSIGLGNETVQLPLVFLDHDNMPRVLGRAGIFDRFTIVFEEAKRRSGFLSWQTEESRRIGDALDSLSA